MVACSPSSSVLAGATPEETCLIKDVTWGAEAIPIPVYGPLKCRLTTFRYQRSAFLETERAKEVATCDQDRQWTDCCGVLANGRPIVTAKGCLKESASSGLFECGPSCWQPECRASLVLSRGVVLPLEIFWTGCCEWGVRCAAAIRRGAFICEYAGAICTTAETEDRCQTYLFDLDHFRRVEEHHCQASKAVQLDERGYQSGSDDGAEGLTIDASDCGNVGRFLNHSCGGNVLIQPVLVYGSSHALYRVGLFAKRDIPAREELRYDYGWRLAAADAGADATGSLPCACGSLACRGWLL